MENTGNLTVERIQEVHAELMSGLRDDAGTLRTCAAYVTWNKEVYFYPEPIIAEQLFYACIDHHTKHMTHYAKEFAPKEPSKEAFAYLFKCAARLMFDFVDAHPFGDGNGHMCRLLANYVLSMITPFPVAPYSSEEGKEDYINAVVECRDNRAQGPGTLAAMLIEGTWRGWTSLFNKLEKYNLLSPKMPIGPVVVSKGDESRMQKIIEALNRFKIHQPDMLEHVAKAIDNEANLSDDAAVPIVIGLSQDVVLSLHVYK